MAEESTMARAGSECGRSEMESFASRRRDEDQYPLEKVAHGTTPGVERNANLEGLAQDAAG